MTFRKGIVKEAGRVIAELAIIDPLCTWAVMQSGEKEVGSSGLICKREQ